MLEIRKYPDPVLCKQCQEVKKINQEIRDLTREMLETMYQHEGIGLAAPQVGVEKRIIVVDIGKGPIILINPKILEVSQEADFMTEGCLSLPNTFVKVERAKKIVVEGFDEYGKQVKLKATGLTARAIQHEVDHLSGILIIDKQNFLKKALEKGKHFFKK